VPAATAARMLLISSLESFHVWPHTLPITVIASPESSIFFRRSIGTLVPCVIAGHSGQRMIKAGKALFYSGVRIRSGGNNAVSEATH
jgi:hypothetical protein